MNCNKNNANARKLYEREGFLATGIEEEDEIEMVRFLAFDIAEQIC